MRNIRTDHSILSFRMSRHDGSLTLMSVVSDVTNAAFMRYSPRHNILYVCTEAITEHGSVIAFRVDNATGILTEISRQSAGGSSTCYLTIDKNARHMLLVNYWDATIGVMPLTSDGRLLPLCEMTHPTGGPASNEVLLAKRSNHSNNDSETQKNRQSDPHSHAVVLDPYAGRIAYVPDLGMDCIHQFTYDPRTGTLHALKPIPCAPTELVSGEEREGSRNCNVYYIYMQAGAIAHGCCAVHRRRSLHVRQACTSVCMQPCNDFTAIIPLLLLTIHII